MRTAPCKDCETRERLIKEKIYNCHSNCGLYQDFKKTRERAREAIRKETESKAAYNEGYKRTTRGKYENYNRR